MKEFDYIFAGAGCAGLSMVYHLLNSPLRSKRILLIDPKIGEIPNKTWCYWAEEALPIHPKDALQSWSKFSIGTERSKKTYPLESLKYWHINSVEFHNYVLPIIKSHDNVEIIQDSVRDIVETDDGIEVQTSNKKFKASFIFDSRLSDSDLNSDASLKQIFAGWRVEFETPVFDSSTFSLMEVGEKTDEDFNFYYVLPYSDRSALIEFTKYDTARTNLEDLELGIKQYLSDNYSDLEYTVTFEENGVIPMSTIKEVNASSRIIPLGTKAGWTKPSTGYTFYTIQKNCEALIQKLESGESLNIQPREKRFKFYDNILLNIAHRWPSQLKGVFLDLFQQNSADQVFKFLGEDTSISEEIKILSRLRFGIFVKSLFSYAKH